MKTRHGIRILRNKALSLGGFLATKELWEIFWNMEIPEKTEA